MRRNESTQGRWCVCFKAELSAKIYGSELDAEIRGSEVSVQICGTKTSALGARMLSADPPSP